MTKRYPAGSLDLAKIQAAIYNWIYNVSQGVLSDGGEIIWRNQSEPLPPRPCVTLKLIDGPKPIARNASTFLNPDGSQNVAVQQEATLSIQIFGNTRVHRPMAYQLAVDLNSSLMRQTILDGLKQAGIGIQQVGAPRNLTALEETEYEERAGFEIVMGLVQNIFDEPSTIETINLEKNIDGSALPNQVIQLP